METENKIAQRKACWKRWPNLSMVSYKLSALIDQYLTMTFQRIENIERERARTHQREQYTQSHARACGRKTMRENRNIDFDGAHSFCFFAATINRQCLAHTHTHMDMISARQHTYRRRRAVSTGTGNRRSTFTNAAEIDLVFLCFYCFELNTNETIASLPLAAVPRTHTHSHSHPTDRCAASESIRLFFLANNIRIEVDIVLSVPMRAR